MTMDTKVNDLHQEQFWHFSFLSFFVFLVCVLGGGGGCAICLDKIVMLYMTVKCVY